MRFLLLILLMSLSAFADDCANCRRGRAVPRVLNFNPEWPLEYIKVRKVNYERNPDASYCKRPVDVVDTIVLHHSETPSSVTPERINDFHLDRGTAADPWLMIAYSYVLNTPYPGESKPEMVMSEGRPLDIVGAHAGTNVFIPMTKDQAQAFKDGKIVCGKKGETFKVDPKQVRDGKIKANVTTIGLVVIGNYVQFSRNNPNGYPANKPRYPSKSTIDSVARMSCQLQKKYPKMKNIKWHSYYHSTDCPGTLKDYIGQIKARAKELGCDFN